MPGGFFSGPKPRIFGHRGAMGEYSENTLLSFERALDSGATCLETDIHASRDGRLVLLHDETLERTTNGCGPLKQCTLAELKSLDAGYGFSPDGGKSHPFRGAGLRIPTLEEFFSRFPGVKVTLEIKQAEPPIEQPLLDLVARMGRLKDVLIASEVDVIMKRVRRLGLDVATSFSAVEVAVFVEEMKEPASAPPPAPGQALQVPPTWGGVPLVTESFVSAAHGRAVEVHVWTVNEVAEMKRLLDLGVDGIMTDFPGRLKALLGSLSPRPLPLEGGEDSGRGFAR
ncbi:MAG: glycerophosphodiester phosphodiesterase [Candidatus Tectomicrobia bacterium]|uniref:Glycerophosphodiester phosphodiesterase n=1 Tax=Tectimicrobiota bacterium TaxID=2528274 RepID=A0A932M277_UNCTE|nr:glycerophosphodiester phosphodiesterase [Candidatus Tectomicrobia bacterium]